MTFRRRTPAVLAFHVTSAEMRVVIADQRRTTLVDKHFPTARTGHDTLLKIIGIADDIRDKYRIQAVCGSARGHFTDDGQLIYSEDPVVNSLANIDLRRLFQRHFGGVPFTMLHTAQAAAVGLIWPREKDKDRYNPPHVYVHWGLEIDVAYIPDEHQLPQITSLGHSIINKDSELLCSCGGIGHWQAYCGAACIPNRRFGNRRGIQIADLTSAQWGIVLRDMCDGLHNACLVLPHADILMYGDVVSCYPKETERIAGFVESYKPKLPKVLLDRTSPIFGSIRVAWQLA